MSSNFLAALPQLWAIRPEALTALVEELRLQPAEACLLYTSDAADE